MTKDSTEGFDLQPEFLVERAQNGEDGIRERLIDRYRGLIGGIVSRMIHTSAYGRDEFSVALEAFNEAIDGYRADRGAPFLSFAELVINRRVIDHIRKASRHRNEYPFTYFELESESDPVEKMLRESPNVLVEHLEIKEEILELRSNLASFGIAFGDLVDKAPRHLDSKQMCAAIAKHIIRNQHLSDKLWATRRLPSAELQRSFGIHPKTLDKNRKYIIALCVILVSDLDIIKGYLSFLPERVH